MTDKIAQIRQLPLWSGPVNPRPLVGGLSNESFVVSDGGRRFVVRTGEDYPFHHVFRDHERMVSAAAHEAGFAPELIYAQPGIMVFAYVEGRTYDGADVRDNMARVVAVIRGYHGKMPAHVSGGARLFWVFHVVRDYARTLQAGNSRAVGEIGRYLALAEALERAQVALPIVFAHNDLLPANFIDDGSKVWLIDFEYAGFSTAMFDLAGIAANAEFTPAQDEALLAAYFGEPPDVALRRSHAAMKCASLLREAMWGMVSELHLAAPGADYGSYANENLARLEAALDSYYSRFGKSGS